MYTGEFDKAAWACPRPATPCIPFSCLWREDSSLQKRMLCGRVSPQRTDCSVQRGQHSQLAVCLAATPITRKATHAEIPAAFPSLIWKKSLKTKERTALLCGFGGFFFPSVFSSLGKKSKKSRIHASCQKYPK